MAISADRLAVVKNGTLHIFKPNVGFGASCWGVCVFASLCRVFATLGIAMSALIKSKGTDIDMLYQFDVHYISNSDPRF